MEAVVFFGLLGALFAWVSWGIVAADSPPKRERGCRMSRKKVAAKKQNH
jgi:hypothetical protein